MTATTAASRGEIVVVTVHGTVNATMAGMTVPVSAGAILELPATVRTGADGAVELRQGNSTFAAASNTELEIPQSAAADGLVERIVQIRGNAFYSIGKRTGSRLRVEAPYLVAVIKGTQFNVAAQDDSTTIALFEGHLEVRATDESDVVNIDAGEIAIRHRNDVTISVLRLNAAAREARRNRELAARPQPDSQNSSTGAVTARTDDTASRPRVDVTLPTDDVAPRDGVSVGVSVTPTEPARVVEALPDVGAEVVAKTSVGEVATVDTAVSTGVDVSAGTVAADTNVGVAAGNVAPVDVGATAAVDVPAGAVDVAADVNVGAVNAGVAVGTSGVDVNLGLGATDESTGLLGGLLGPKRRN
jgi:hypothetical protein